MALICTQSARILTMPFLLNRPIRRRILTRVGFRPFAPIPFASASSLVALA